ncbi:MAG: helix-turn-helix domain-containing protein [Deltaproteobacteria bacterium]|nr:helix-turn-helix domain-containing protein [Deltaproteobacteria bacterium]
MATKAYKRIKEGMLDAIAYAQGDNSTGHIVTRIQVPTVDVKAIRKKLNLTQDEFSRMFGLSKETIRNWEQGKRQPEGPARILLLVIDRKPQAVLQALAS